MGAVAAIPLVVFVIVLVELDKVLVVAEDTRELRFNAVEDTPFTVDVRLVPFNESALEFTIETLPPDTPFIWVKMELPELVLFTAFTIGTPLPIIPFTVVDNTLFELELLTELMIFTEDPTPLIVLVKTLLA